MRLLTDTQTFIWIHDEPQKISRRALAELKNPANELILSAVSLWELQIKIQINKFKFNDTLANVVAMEQKANGFQLLPITFAHILELEKLPFHHKDPFDRLLIAQANAEKMVLVSSDSKFSAYLVNLLW